MLRTPPHGVLGIEMIRLSGAGEEVLDTGSRRRGIEGVKAGLLGGDLDGT